MSTPLFTQPSNVKKDTDNNVNTSSSRLKEYLISRHMVFEETSSGNSTIIEIKTARNPNQ